MNYFENNSINDLDVLKHQIESARLHKLLSLLGYAIVEFERIQDMAKEANQNPKDNLIHLCDIANIAEMTENFLRSNLEAKNE